VSFEWPTLLASLGLLPILLGLYVLAERRRRRYAVRFTNLALLQQVVGRGPGVRRHIPPLLFLLGFGALLVGLARPQAVIADPRRSASSPASTAPTRLPSRKAVNAQPYDPRPSSSIAAVGRIVATASDSKATTETLTTMPKLSTRRRGGRTPLIGLRRCAVRSAALTEPRLSSTLPISKHAQELCAHSGLDRVLWQMAKRSDGLAHLRQVLSAARAGFQVRVKPGSLRQRQRVLQIVSYELHQVVACQFVRGRHHGSLSCPSGTAPRRVALASVRDAAAHVDLFQKSARRYTPLRPSSRLHPAS
jgi:hypothetical protein